MLISRKGQPVTSSTEQERDQFAEQRADLGRAIREFREALGMSQRELADAANATQARVSAWESGDTFPRYDRLIRVAGVFRVSVSVLVATAEGIAAIRKARQQ